jgi:hypothetical protein
MSLDVYLLGPEVKEDCQCNSCGHVHKRTYAPQFYEANITHNLGMMATEAGVYEILWRPDEVGITRAHQLIEQLKTGLAYLQANPDRFRKLNPPNGFGNYEGLVSFVHSYLSACIVNPEALIKVSR